MKQSPLNPIPGLVLYGYRGSITHGTYIPPKDPHSIEDKDTIGIYIDSIDNYFGVPKNRNRGVVEWFWGEYDIVCYEIRKMFSLLLKCNPNVMSLLWLEDKHYIKKKPIGQRIIDNRHLFVSKLAHKAFTGYAYGQLKRMESHTKDGYMGAKRKALVDKYGYDCKNAGHLIRLLRMGIEFLSTGELNIHRQEAPMLIDIKCGKWTLEQVKTEAQKLFNLSDEAFIRSKLPDKPNKHEAELLLIDILENYFLKQNDNK